jgi:hypothetical protein
MNTLNFEHKIKSENPFDFPDKYPAFSYKNEIDDDAIMESDEASSNSDKQEFDYVDDLIDIEQLDDT